MRIRVGVVRQRFGIKDQLLGSCLWLLSYLLLVLLIPVRMTIIQEYLGLN
jgi:hypothetical protein